MADLQSSGDNYFITYGHTKPILDKCCYVWTLEMFQDLGREDKENSSEIRSPWFSSVKSECRWCLQLTPYDKTEVTPRVVVQLISGKKPDNLVAFGGSCIFNNSQGQDVDYPRKFSGLRTDYAVFIIYSIDRQRLLNVLQDDVLKIRVDVKAILTEITTDYIPQILENSVPSHMLSLLKSKEFTDLTVTTKGMSFSVHKCILASRSPVFKARLQTEASETPVECMDMQGFEAATVEALLNFVYSGKLGEVSVTMAIDLLRAAEMYQVKDLERYCVDKLLSKLGNHNVVEICLATEKYNIPEVKEKCLRFLIDNKNDVEIPQEQGDGNDERGSMLSMISLLL